MPNLNVWYVDHPAYGTLGWVVIAATAERAIELVIQSNPQHWEKRREKLSAEPAGTVKDEWVSREFMW